MPILTPTNPMRCPKCEVTCIFRITGGGIGVETLPYYECPKCHTLQMSAHTKIVYERAHMNSTLLRGFEENARTYLKEVT